MDPDSGTGTVLPEGGTGIAVVSSGRDFRALVVALSLAWAASRDGRRPLVSVWDETGFPSLLEASGEPVPGSSAAYGLGILDGETLPVLPFRGFDLLRLDDALVPADRLPELQRRLEQDHDLVLQVPSFSLRPAGSASSVITRQSERLVVVASQTFPGIVGAYRIATGTGAGRTVLAVDRYNPKAPPPLAEIESLLPGIPVVLLPADTTIVHRAFRDGLLGVERPESAAYLAGIRELLAVLDAG